MEPMICATCHTRFGEASALDVSSVTTVTSVMNHGTGAQEEMVNIVSQVGLAKKIGRPESIPATTFESKYVTYVLLRHNLDLLLAFGIDARGVLPLVFLFIPSYICL